VIGGENVVFSVLVYSEISDHPVIANVLNYINLEYFYLGYFSHREIIKIITDTIAIPEIRIAINAIQNKQLAVACSSANNA